MENIVLPNYEHSILNLINSILKYYNVETNYKGLSELDTILNKKYKNIVLFVLDGMGENVLEKNSPNGYFSKNKLAKITSVSPSTTTAAITTYYSGKPPIETGWIAMSQYFKEYGRAVEMFRRTDSYTEEILPKAKIDVFNLVNYISTYDQIEKASPNVRAYEINPSFCVKRHKRSINADSFDVFCDSIKSICTNDEQNFIFAYNTNPDSLLHKYGCTSDLVREFIRDAESRIEKMANELKDTETLIIISADHGHKDIDKVYNIIDLKELQEYMIMPASFESRFITFWIKPNKKQEFEKYFNDKFNGEFILLNKQEILNRKLLGIGEQHRKTDDFIGDYIAISIGSSIIQLGTNISKEKPLKKSTHCGLTPDEMEVPVIVIK